jgi:hypothetical protein
VISMHCQCEAEHGDSEECEGEQEATCSLCDLRVCLGCMEGDEGQAMCTVCWDAIHVDELPECVADNHSHRATWMAAISTSQPVVRIFVCPLEWATYEAQGSRARG